MADRFKITPSKIEDFLRHYRECLGNFSEAARKISAHGDAKTNKGKTPAGYAALKAHAKRDPNFAGRIAEVDAQILDDVEAVIARRAVGWQEPVFSAGKHAKLHDGTPAYVEKYDSKLLLAVARKLAPESWSEKHIHEYHHYVENQRWSITLEEINRLPADMMANLSAIIDHLEFDRKARDGHSVRALPATIIDADFELIEWDDHGNSRQVKREIKE